MEILPYHRMVKDLGELFPSAFLERVGTVGALSRSTRPSRVAAGSCALYLNEKWFSLVLPPVADDVSSPVEALDYQRVQDLVLSAVPGVGDPRTDPRVECIGGARGPAELERRVNAGDVALALAMPATQLNDILGVADAGGLMPPKSTWFEPKLLSGLFVHPFRNGP